MIVSIRLPLVLLAVALALLSCPVPTIAQSRTASLYQGSLRSGGSPYSGEADVRFQVFDSALGGQPIGPRQTVLGVDVSNGLFSAEFDPGVLDGPSAWLEISVRVPAGSGGYVTLQPRQRLAATPRAASVVGVSPAVGLDQESFGLDLLAAGDITQSFTAGFSGALEALEIFVSGGAVIAGGTLTIRIRDASGIDVFVGSRSLTGLAGGWQRFDTAPFRPYLAEGRSYSFSLRLADPPPGVGVALSIQNVYAGGAVAGCPDCDLGFRTYVRGAALSAERLGLGTDQPRARLDVAGDARFSGHVGVGLADAAPTSALDINGDLTQRNGNVLRAFDNAQNLQNWMWPRWVDNWMYTNFGPNGWFIRNNDSVHVVTMLPNGNVGIGTNTPAHRLTVAGDVSANNVAVPSSGRFKEHIRPIDDALAGLLRLEGVRFEWKPAWAAARPGRECDLGFVAEDVASVFPEVVFRDEHGQVTGMDYSRLVAVAVQAIKQQHADMTTELARRDAEIADLRARFERLEAAVAGGSRATPDAR